MKTYRMQEAEISVPDEWRDKTIQLFVLPNDGGGEATLVVSRDAETKAASLDGYVDGQLTEAGKRLNRFRFISRNAITIGGKPAVEIDYLWTTPERIELHQRQAYAEWPGCFLIFTLTTRTSDFGRHEANWRQTLESVRFRYPEE